MAALKLFWTETAIRQRNFVFEYWNERNKSFTYSKKLNAKINQRTTILKVSPNIGKPTEYKDTRMVSLGHYSIFYKQEDSKIIIMGFWDNRQEPQKLLRFLKQD